MKTLIKDVVVEDLPPVFLIKLIDLMSNVYRDAKVKTDEGLGLSTKGVDFVMPYVRCAKADDALYQAGCEAGMNTTVEKAVSGAHQYSLVQSGRLSLTISYVCGQGALPRPSKHRSQYSELNEHLSQRSLFDLDDDVMRPAANDGDIYGVILHGTDPCDDTLPGFLRIGFPNQNFTAYEEIIDLHDVHDAQSLRYRKPDIDVHEQYQIIEPTLKTMDEAKEED